MTCNSLTEVRLAIVLSMTLVISACASSYKQSDITKPSARLDPNKTVLVSTPPDAWFEQTQYRNSGRMTLNEVKAAFAAHASKVDATEDCHGEACLSLSREGGYGYYVRPEILHWEDRATEWSGRSDQVEIQLIVTDVESAAELANVTYHGTSKWLTLGGDHPQDLLAEPTKEYVDSLY